MKAAIALFIIVLAVIVVVGLWWAWEDFIGQLEIRQLEAEIRANEAEASKLHEETELKEAQSEFERAQGERSLKESQGSAILAPALAAARVVDRQSFVVGVWSLLGPPGIIIFCGMLLVSGVTIGAAYSGTVMLVMLNRMKEVPESTS